MLNLLAPNAAPARKSHLHGLCALAVGCATLFAAEARVVYMTPEGAGAGDGTSWANAWKGADLASFNAAYTNASEGATADAPGEIWMKFGEYKLTLPNASFAIPMQPNVIFRGGFLGTETVASAANPTNNPTVICSEYFDADEKWTRSTDKATWQMWARGDDGRLTFFEPPSEGDTEMYKNDAYRGSVNNQIAFAYSNEVADVGVAAFHGLTFTKFYGQVFLIETPTERPVVFRACRFLNFGWYGERNERFGIDLTDTGLDMQDCELVSAMNPLMVRTTATNSPARTATFRNCRFSTMRGSYVTHNRAGTTGGILAANNVALTIRGCTFDRNVAQCGNNNRDTQAAAVSARTMRDVLIEDTVFSRSCGNREEAGGAFVWVAQSDAKLTVRRCRFENCAYVGGGGVHETRAAAVSMRGIYGTTGHRGLFENVAFIGNWTSNTVSGAETASCVSFGSNGGGTFAVDFVNCLFERNRSFHSYTNGTAGTTVCYSWTLSPECVFLNCVFKDNVCGKYAEDGTPAYTGEFCRHHKTFRFSFVNTIFENKERTARPWSVDSEYATEEWASLANVATDAEVTIADPIWKDCFYRYAPCATNTTIGLDDRLFTNGVVVARRLSTSSAYRRAGRPVWAGTDGEYYLYDAAGDKANPWRNCRKGKTRLSDAAALAVGVSLTAAPVPDAFGTARKVEYCGLGSLEPRQPGLLLIVR